MSFNCNMCGGKHATVGELGKCAAKKPFEKATPGSGKTGIINVMQRAGGWKPPPDVPLKGIRRDGDATARCIAVSAAGCRCVLLAGHAPDHLYDPVAENFVRSRAARVGERRPPVWARVTEEQLDRLGRLVDRIDNLIHAGVLPIPDALRVKCLHESLPDLHSELKTLYVEIAGDDPWAEPSS